MYLCIYFYHLFLREIKKREIIPHRNSISSVNTHNHKFWEMSVSNKRMD
jgi:hypothetical protein